MSSLQDLTQVLSRKQEILDGNQAGVEKQKKSGKQTARERIAQLVDAGSFVEQGMLMEAGVVTGCGSVDGQPVCVFAQDFAANGAAMGAKQAAKIVKLLDVARKTGTPVIGILDSNGAYISEGAGAVEAYADVLSHMARMSGVVPMIMAVLGPCVGAAAVMAEMADVSVVAKAGSVLLAGPQVLSSTMGKDLDAEALGGAQKAVENGAAAVACETEAEAIEAVKSVLAMLPANNLEDAPIGGEEDAARKISGFEAGCDGGKLIEAVADAGSVVELGKGYTKAVTAFGRIAGRSVAFVYTGSGDICEKRMLKIARFVRFADCFNIPVVSLMDTTGLKIWDTVQRHTAVLKAASTLVFAYSEATTAKIAVVIGKAIGSAYTAMGGKANSDLTYAWPGSVIAPVSGEAAIQLEWKDKIAASEGDPVKAREALAAQYEAEVFDGIHAAEKGLVDDVIDPADTRKALAAAIEMLAGKRDSNPPKKHDNMPL